MNNVRPVRALFVASLLTITAACAPATVRRPGSITELPAGSDGVSLEVEATVEEQAQEAVGIAPTSFMIGIEDDRNAWDRARIFFEKYLGSSVPGKSAMVTKAKGNKFGLSSSPTVPGSYAYEVMRESIPNGYRYSVTCSPKKGGSQQLAMVNAQNLARFIQDGRLELSLIHR